MFLNLYKALVRPQLEYTNVIWHPTKIEDIMFKKLRCHFLLFSVRFSVLRNFECNDIL